VFFLIAAFIFFVMWAVSSFVIDEFDTALDDIDTDLPSDYHDLKSLISSAFGILCAIFFVVGILLIFLLDALADEPEMYYTGGRRFR